jgi:ankyrin repeat protein
MDGALPFPCGAQTAGRLAGFTPLSIACAKGRLSIVDLLLASGASVNSMSAEGYPPLHYAFKEGFLGVVERLLERGASVSARVFVKACREAPKRVVAAMLRCGASSDAFVSW